MTLHYLIEKDGDLYSALCLELDGASQGTTNTGVCCKGSAGSVFCESWVEVVTEPVTERGLVPTHLVWHSGVVSARGCQETSKKPPQQQVTTSNQIGYFQSPTEAPA